MLLKLAWRNLWRNKRRTLITTGSVFFAALLSIFLNSLQSGVYDRLIQNMVGNFSGYIQIHENGFWDEQIIDNTFEHTAELTELAEAHKMVKTAVPRFESFALAISGDLSRPAMIIGVHPEMENNLTQLSQKLTQGNYFESGGTEAMLSEGLAKKLELGIGDTIVLLGQGYQGATAAGKYAIGGFLKFGSPDLNERLIYLPLQEAQAMYVAPDRLTSFALGIDPPRKSAEIASELKQTLPERYEVMDWQEMMPDIVQFIQADKGGNRITLGILYVLVAFGIFGTVLMMTAERKYEFGVLTAIGMKPRILATTVFLETLFMSLLGVLAGTAIALPLVVFFNRFPIRLESVAEAYAEFGFEPTFPTAIDPTIFMNQAIVVFFIALVVCIYPVFQIYRLDPVKSMHV